MASLCVRARADGAFVVGGRFRACIELSSASPKDAFRVEWLAAQLCGVQSDRSGSALPTGGVTSSADVLEEFPLSDGMECVLASPVHRIATDVFVRPDNILR